METPPKKLEIHYDSLMDQVTIEGVVYAGGVFRGLGMFPLGTCVRIVKREDGIIHLEKLDMTRIRIGPLKIKCAHCKQVDELTLDLENPATAAPPEEPK